MCLTVLAVTVRPIRVLGDPVLRTPSEPVTSFDAELRALVQDLVDTVALPGRAGLAAPQIGVMLRLAVVDASRDRGQAVRLANPELLEASAERGRHDEASPNLPGVSAMVERPRAVVVRFLNEAGTSETRDFTGLWATSVQHQIDHLDGRMYFDRLTPLRRQMLLRRADKLRLRR